MNVTIGRTLVAVVSSAGLLVGGAATASAGGHDDHGKDKYGWVKVCQEVKKDKDHDYAKDRDDKKDKYVGKYRVKDSRDDVHKFKLEGKYDCYQVKVHAGWVKVKVVEKPDHTKLK